MGLTYEGAAKLFRQGEFAELIRDSGHRDARAVLEPPHRAILAYSLAVGGELEEARRLADIDSLASAALVRSQIESVRSFVSSRTGDFKSALEHAYAAVTIAQEGKDPERVAWAHLSQFRLLTECGLTDKALTALPDMRRVVARAGNSHQLRTFTYA